MNTFQLECFVAVAEHLSFVHAAESLHVTQPAVSHQISTLEQELGVKLFQRSTRTVRITHDGTIFLDDAREILKRERRARARFRNPSARKTNPLGIGLSSPMQVEAVVRTIASMNGSIEGFRPHLVIESAPRLLRALEEGSIDVALGFEGMDRLPARIERSELARFPLHAVFLGESPLAARDEVGVGDLADSPVVVIPPEQVPSGVSSVQAEIVSGHTRDQIHFCESIEAAITLVRAGMGAIVLPLPIVPPDPALTTRPLVGCERVAFNVFLRTSEAGERNPLLDTFLATAQAKFRV